MAIRKHHLPPGIVPTGKATNGLAEWSETATISWISRPNLLFGIIVFILEVVGFFGTVCSSRAFAAEPNWPVISLTPVLSGVEQTVDIQNAADGSGRLFLVRQNGAIQIYKDGALLPTPLLDVADRIMVSGEQGLLGLAFPPDFSVKKCFYVCYSRSMDGATILSRFKMGSEPDIALPESEEILLVTPQHRSNHNGGQLAFGPDGFLYIAIGDGGGQGDPYRKSQDLTSRLGKILRIDVSTQPEKSEGQPFPGETSDSLYSVPPSNPFATSDTYAPEIVCWGLRNPWRFSFDPTTGDLFIGDVGESQREEINFIPAEAIENGTNLGWSVKEGTLDFDINQQTLGELQPPKFEYDHTLGKSVTGGYVYRGSNPRLHGFYLFGDFTSGRIWAMNSPSAGGQVLMIKDTSYSLSTFGKDEAGEIYFADYFGGGIYRIDAPDTLPTPTIRPHAGTYTGSVNSTIETDAPGAVVRFTTDGSTPDASSPIFAPGEWLERQEPFTLRAATFRADLIQSPVSEAAYTLRPGDVEISGGNGRLNDYTTIYLTSITPGADIHYTQDGSDPTLSSSLYSAQIGIPISRSLSIKAIPFRAGNGWIDGAISSKYFQLRVGDPTFSAPLFDLYDPVQVVSLTPGSVIHYTTDGTQPSSQSPVWEDAQDLAAGTVVWALAKKGEMDTSTATLTVKRISAEKVRFEKLGTGYLTSASDVVRAGDSSFYAIGPSKIWKLSDGAWTTFHQGGFAQSFQSIVVTADNKLAIADFATQSIIQFLPPSPEASNRWASSSVKPSDLVSLSDGGFLMADRSGHRIQKITDSYEVTPFAGSGTAGSDDGPSLQATFNEPVGIAKDAEGRIYIAECAGRRVRMIDVDGMVKTIAGGDQNGSADGPIANARFAQPLAIVCDRIGNLYISDEKPGQAGRIRKISPDGTVSTLVGPTYKTGTSAILSNYSFGVSAPRGLHVDEDGVVYIAGDYTVTKAVQEDWDNDGIPDDIEIILGAPFIVGIDDRLADSDGDLISNHAEWIAGTKPLEPNSQPEDAIVTRHPDGNVDLYFPCESGEIHCLEFSDDLLTWKPLELAAATALRSFSSSLNATPNASRRFYRLRSSP